MTGYWLLVVLMVVFSFGFVSGAFWLAGKRTSSQGIISPPTGKEIDPLEEEHYVREA